MHHRDRYQTVRLLGNVQRKEEYERKLEADVANYNPWGKVREPTMLDSLSPLAPGIFFYPFAKPCFCGCD
jgi:hypothetical protein